MKNIFIEIYIHIFQPNMKLYIKDIKLHNSTEITCSENDAIEKLYSHILDTYTQFKHNKHYLVYLGKILLSDKFIFQYNLHDNDTIYWIHNNEIKIKCSIDQFDGIIYLVIPKTGKLEIIYDLFLQKISNNEYLLDHFLNYDMSMINLKNNTELNDPYILDDNDHIMFLCQSH